MSKFCKNDILKTKMTVTEIEKRAKLITGKSGKPVEVILPYTIFKHLLELERSMEIFSRRETQESIKRAKEDIKHGRVKTFSDMTDAFKWLDK
ncbi:MAG: hypothetical protein HZA11_03530 [Nitrospirae bacterium]|nr:hypothetical protein [Nitrospirota bacterium]